MVETDPIPTTDVEATTPVSTVVDPSPESTVVDVAPESTVPATTVPGTTVPGTTVPGSTVPAPTVVFAPIAPNADDEAATTEPDGLIALAAPGDVTVEAVCDTGFHPAIHITSLSTANIRVSVGRNAFDLAPFDEVDVEWPMIEGDPPTLDPAPKWDAVDLDADPAEVFDEGILSLPIDCPPVDVPSAPLDMASVAGDATVTLSWTEPDFDGGSGITDYTIEHNVVPDRARWMDARRRRCRDGHLVRRDRLDERRDVPVPNPGGQRHWSRRRRRGQGHPERHPECAEPPHRRADDRCRSAPPDVDSAVHGPPDLRVLDRALGDGRGLGAVDVGRRRRDDVRRRRADPADHLHYRVFAHNSIGQSAPSNSMAASRTPSRRHRPG